MTFETAGKKIALHGSKKIATRTNAATGRRLRKDIQ
jgi:hypothetical protein